MTQFVIMTIDLNERRLFPRISRVFDLLHVNMHAHNILPPPNRRSEYIMSIDRNDLLNISKQISSDINRKKYVENMSASVNVAFTPTISLLILHDVGFWTGFN